MTSPFRQGPSATAAASSSVVSESVVSWAAGTQAVLRCQSPRMVWTQDRLHDRQRVVHWDLSGVPGSQGRRLVDMYSAGEQRVYEPRDNGRLLLSPSAFHDGNFSLLIRAAVEEGDEGVYTCNLHHHYCHLYESLAVRLEVTDDPREYWDGEKEVMVVARGTPALMTCVNRAHLWTDRHLEEAQQVVHWDRQLPGVPHDRADRLLDLYASGERRAYGPSFLRDRVAVNTDAFARGDFSLRIDALEPADEGIYSCHLHHHYCGLHERRVFHLQVTEPALEPPAPASPGNGSGHNSAPGPGFETSDKKAGKLKGKDVNMTEFAVATGDQAPYRTEDIQLDYKNNILKERAELAHSPLPAKNVDLDKEFRKEYCK
ncbi:hypothetical protein A6R68_04894 [Neotoma lepida]|uniref:Matrix remodeling-associated protein 8 n=1 Tax=Neotoma lepida TaxID=56216 RepID=A0A1A6GMJ7_NEOLE|nr:hypothetical protein A6R68_04894 [Neotoma lepida]